MDPPLSKAEWQHLIYLRSGKNPVQLQLERRVGVCEKKSTAGTKVSEEWWRGGAPAARPEIPLQPMGKTIVRQAVSLQTVEAHGGDTPAAHGGSCARTEGCP